MTDSPGKNVTSEEVEDWIIGKLVQQMNVNPAEIEADKRLANYGIDSLQMFSLVGQIEEWLGCHFTANPLERHPSIRALSTFIAGQLVLGETELDPTKA